MNTDEVKKILVIRLSALGDVVRTLPAVTSIARAYPDAEITWVTETLGASFVSGHPLVNTVIVFPTRLWRRTFLTPAGFVRVIREFFRFRRQLRAEEYDIVVDFHGVLKSALVCRIARTARRVGYDSTGAKEGSYLFYSETVDIGPQKQSRYDRNMKLARYLGGNEPDRSDFISIPSEIKEELAPFLDKIDGPGPLIAIHPGTSARAPYKRWFPGRYASLCDTIVTQMNGRVILTWAPDEYEFVTTIAEATHENVHVAPRTETTVHLAYLLSASDIYVGSDTGAMHIATLAGTPVVAIWGPTDPVENEPGPYSTHEMVHTPVDCSPCRKMGCLLGICMEAVEVDEVADAVRMMLTRLDE